MNNVITLNPQEQIKAESAFISLLEEHCNQEGAIKPLSNTFFDRIERLKAKAEAAKQRHEVVLLEG